MSISAAFANSFPPIPVALPLLMAAALASLRKQLSRAVIDFVASATALLHSVICFALLLEAQNRTIVYWFGNWRPRGTIVLGIAFVIDPASAALACLCGFLTLLALLFSWRFTDSGANHMQPLILVFLAGMSGFCLTGDLFNMFVFFELMSTAAFALTGLQTREPAPLQGAFNFAVTNTVAAFLVLTGIAFLYAITGALNLAQIGLQIQHRHDPVVLFACALLTCGFFTKAAVVPFHLWLPDAHAVSPTSVCVLFSGVMVELGLYAILRIYAVVFIPALDQKAAILRVIFLSFGTATVIVGAVMCYAEHHIKRVLAFSTISHSGLMLVAIGLEDPLAIAGFFVYLAAHAFIKSGLFFVSGILLHRFRTASEHLLFARGKGFWVIGTFWFLGGMGLAGMPCFATVLGEALTTSAAARSHFEWIAYLFMIGGFLTAAAVFRVGFHTFFGWGTGAISDRSSEVDEMPESNESDEQIPWFLVFPPALCLAAGVFMTFIPQVRNAALNAASRLHDQPGYLHLVYTGSQISGLLPSHAAIDIGRASIHGTLAASLAVMLALSSVFRRRLPRLFRVGAFLEGPLVALRRIQSGHVGDYVLWQTIGIAAAGASLILLCK